MRVFVAYLIAIFSPALVSAAENVAPPNLVEGAKLVAINSVGVAGVNNATRGTAATIYDSFTGAATLTTTTGSPRTYMSAPFTVASGPTTVQINEATVYLAATANQTFANGLVIRVQLWDDFDGSSASAIFSNPVGAVQTFTVPGPVTLTANTFTPIDLTFAAPVTLNGLTGGFSVNYQGDNGAGPVSADALTSLLRAQAEPGSGTLAVGSFQASGTYVGPDWGFYRNVANQTNFNHPNSDRRTFTGLDDISLALQLRGPAAVAPVVAIAPTTLTGGTGSVTPTITTPAQGSGSTQFACSIPPTAPSNFAITSNASQTITTTTAAIGLTCVPQAAATTATLTCTQTATPGPNPADATAVITCPALPTADLSITKTDGVSTVNPNGTTTYIITASNAGPDAVSGATIVDTFPAGLTCSTTCVGAGGGTCTAGPVTTNINDTVNLPNGAAVTYTAVCQIAGSASGSIANTATVTAPGGVTDPTPGNNSATDTNTVAPAGQLTIAPATVDFGAVAPGGTSTTQTVTLGNTGGSPLQVTALTAATAPFTATGGTCGAVPITIANGSSCTLTYTFSPTASGAVSQVLNVTANAPGSGTITLQGTGGTGVVGVLSANLNFGNQNVGANNQQVLTITNTGTGPLTVNSLSAVTPPFTQVTGGTCGPTPFVIAAGGNCTVLYRFAPTTAGTFTQVLTITSDVGTATATLTGRGVVAIALPVGNTLGSLLLLGVFALTAGLVLRRKA